MIRGNDGGGGSAGLGWFSWQPQAAGWTEASAAHGHVRTAGQCLCVCVCVYASGPQVLATHAHTQRARHTYAACMCRGLQLLHCGCSNIITNGNRYARHRYKIHGIHEIHEIPESEEWRMLCVRWRILEFSICHTLSPPSFPLPSLYMLAQQCANLVSEMILPSPFPPALAQLKPDINMLCKIYALHAATATGTGSALMPHFYFRWSLQLTVYCLPLLLQRCKQIEIDGRPNSAALLRSRFPFLSLSPSRCPCPRPCL